MPKTKVKINIGGAEINIVCEESESYVRSIAAEVNDALSKSEKANSGLPKSIIGALVMMDFCDKARKAEDKLHSTDSRLKECIHTTAESQIMTEKLREDNTELKEKLKRVNKNSKI